MGAKIQILATSTGQAIVALQTRTRCSSTDEYGLQSVLTFSKTFMLNWVGMTLAYFVWSAVIYPSFFSPLRHFPSPAKGNFLIGQTRDILREPTGKLQRQWIDEIPNDGVIRYRMWTRDRLFLTSAKAIGEVLVQKSYEFVKPPEARNGLIRLLGEGILLAEGDEHKFQRKNLNPAFSYRHVKDLYPVFWRKAREMVQVLADASADAKAGKNQASRLHPGAIDVGSYTSRATLDIVGLAGMGNDFNSLQNPDNKLNTMYRKVFNPGKITLALQIAAAFVPFWLLSRIPIRRNEEIKEASAYVKKICLDMVQKKRRLMAEGKNDGTDIISVALESNAFTDEQLVNQCMTFLAAGHETTATTMIWAIFLLCRHPQIQEKLRAEIRKSLPSIDADVTASDVDNCSYLQAVCLETLRVRSPVSLTLRLATSDGTICEKPVPKGTLIIVAPEAINLSTQHWGPDAKEFKPERWLDSNGKANNRGSANSAYSFLTFLHGPRACIGQRFAQAEFACLLAAWIGRYKTEFEENSPLAFGEPEIQGGIAPKPKDGCWVKLTEVAGW